MQFIQSKFSLISESTILQVYIYMCPSKRKPTLQVKSYFWDN